MEWIRVVLVCLLLGRAIYTDVKKGIIENRNMLSGLIVACIWTYWNVGMSGLLKSVKMIVFTFVILFMVYIVKGVGAGDVKLLCVLSAFYPDCSVDIVVISFLVAAVISVGKMLVRWVQRKAVLISGETILFSIPVGIGTGIVLLQQYITMRV